MTFGPSRIEDIDRHLRRRRDARDRGVVAGVDRRLGSASAVKAALRYVFPDHWSFMLGEIALYAFVVLVATGIFLALYFQPDTSSTVPYTGSYGPLHGAMVSRAYGSVVALSFDVPAGLVIRQAHHWAALVFVVAIVMHLLRLFFTGAFRRPRELNWVIGLTMLALGILEGFAGYSLPDDLLSGMGLAIAYGVAMSVPVVGANASFLIWGAQFPGSAAFEPRLFIAHVLLLPIALAVLITVHLAIVMRQHHTQFAGPGRTERNVVGTPMWPGYALRSLGLLFAVAGVLMLLGGLVQINPIWLYGPYEPALGTNGAQPDWYLGWLIGALRLMPGFDVVIFGHTLIPNPFWGGVAFPTVVFGVLYAYPWIERLLTGDRAEHHLLDRPRDRPARTAFGAAFFTWVATIFVAGSADRILVSVGISYPAQVVAFRVGAVALPILVFLITHRVCRELRATQAHPLHDPGAHEVARNAQGGFDVLRR